MTPLFAVLTGALVGALLAAERRPGPVRGWIKAAASASFVATAVSAGAAETGFGRWVLAALALSMAGDVALVSRSRSWFLAGLSAFLAAHVAYTVAFGVRGIAGPVTVIAAAALVVPAALVLRRLWPGVPAPLRGPVAAYVGAISVMVAMAVGTNAHDAAPVVVAAAVAFYVSDLFVARDRFVEPGIVNRYWGLPIYYLAQLLFALSV